MEIAHYFDPVDLLDFTPAADGPAHIRMGDVIKFHDSTTDFPDYVSADIAIIGIPEERNAVNNEGCALGCDFIRRHLCHLFPGNFKPNVVDLGNVKKGFAISDTYFAVSSVIAELLRHNTLPIIIGGSQDLTFAHYQAYENLGQIINIVSVDSMFDIGKAEEEIDSRSFLSSIILHQPNFLFNYANIGYQTYFVDQEALSLMKSLMFDTFRLGVVRHNLEETEPIVRNADLVTFDISAIRGADASGNGNASPNGLTAEEACQITRYAGLSDKLTSIGFFEMNPKFDRGGQTAQLVAQMIWYFLDGYYNRLKDFPSADDEDYTRYHVTISDHKEELVFFKSKKSDRWWMEIPLQSDMKIRYRRHHLVPCSYLDYKTACNNEIPDRWWLVYQKLM